MRLGQLKQTVRLIDKFEYVNHDGSSCRPELDVFNLNFPTLNKSESIFKEHFLSPEPKKNLIIFYFFIYSYAKTLKYNKSLKISNYFDGF